MTMVVVVVVMMMMMIDDDDDKMEKAAEQDSDEGWRYLPVELQMNKRTLGKLLIKEYSEI